VHHLCLYLLFWLLVPSIVTGVLHAFMVLAMPGYSLLQELGAPPAVRIMLAIALEVLILVASAWIILRAWRGLQASLNPRVR